MDERQRIELDALRVLAGADEVQRSIVTALTLGNPGVEAVAYMIKSRIKSHEKIVQKILEKQSGDKPTYKAEDVTDIVGVRLLSLFKKELPDLVRQFLGFVQFSLHDPLNLIAGDDIKNALKEAIIYRTSQTEDITDRLVIRAFRRVGLVVKVVPPEMSAKDVDADVKVVFKPSEYSSIHLIVRCYVRKSRRKFTVPVEIQIRSAFEDVWGEIDHRLKYKSRDGSPATLDDRNKPFFDNAASQIRSLKHLMDGCSRTADDIHELISLIFKAPAFSVKSELRSSASIDTHKLLALKLPSKLKTQVEITVKKINSLFQKLSDQWDGNDSASLFKFVNDFVECALDLEGVLEEYHRNPRPAVDDRDVTYYLRMERALCLYWAYRLRMSPHMKSMDGVPTELNQDFLEGSLDEYFDLQRDPRYSRDPILAFRIANALSLRGDISFASEMYQEAMEYMSESDLPLQHHMRTKIPLYLGVALWNLAHEIRRRAKESGNSRLRISVRRRYYLDALCITHAVVGKATKSNETDAFSNDPVEENMITLNNVIEYVCCFLDADGTWDELSASDSKITRDLFSIYLDQVVGNGIEEVERPTVADTIRKAADYLERYDLADSAAERVLALITRPDWAVLLPTEAYDDMLTDALAQLEKRKNRAIPTVVPRAPPINGR